MDSPVGIAVNGVTLTEAQVEAIMFTLLSMCKGIEMEMVASIASERDKELYKQLEGVRKIASIRV